MLLVKQIKIDALENTEEKLIKKICHKLNIQKAAILEYKIIKKSLDARKKEQIFYVYDVLIKLENENSILKRNILNVSLAENKNYHFVLNGTSKLNSRPVVVGSGPAGLFASYMLCQKGLSPLIIERGKCIEERKKDVELFWQTGILNENSNVQFGEGGAGTFSDGKLNTLSKDEGLRGTYVFETFVKFGAPKEILYSFQPHIGTDILEKVVTNMRKEIIKLGGKFLYNTVLTDIEITNNHVTAIEVNHKEKIACEVLILAIGHSARDTFQMLLKRNLDMQNKPFAVGLRVSHSQKMINNAQYNEKYAKVLPNASYKLTFTDESKKGVYSFCMCPGGYVVNASSQKNRLVINGMSYSKRDSQNANSAIVVTVNEEDYGSSILAGMYFQENLEKKAYELGNGCIPVQLLKDYEENKVSSSFKSVQPLFKGNTSFANLNELFSPKINNALKNAFKSFDKKIKGFANPDTILAGIESRTSSPVRIIRSENMESNILGIYPCGEGAGYAGGITTSAIDGIKVSEKIISKYQKQN